MANYTISPVCCIFLPADRYLHFPCFHFDAKMMQKESLIIYLDSITLKFTYLNYFDIFNGKSHKLFWFFYWGSPPLALMKDLMIRSTSDLIILLNQTINQIIAHINTSLSGLFHRTEECRSKDLRGGAFSTRLFDSVFFMLPSKYCKNL